LSVVVFCGPTIGRTEVSRELEAEVLPPAARGDIARAVFRRASAIALVDGYFDRIPSVWHKEILWALSEGIPVFGASSMGALRAAELAPFGMVGVGEIFEAYRDGTLIDDDEVAVAHASVEQDFRLLSEAMVNVRATLRAAWRASQISESTRSALERIAKSLHYADRSYPTLISLSRTSGLPADELSAFREWLPSGRVDQKRLDAQAMLRVVAALDHSGRPGNMPRPAFSWTAGWDGLLAEVRAGTHDTAIEHSARSPEDRLFDELLVAGCAGRAQDGALVRTLSLEQARWSRVEVNARAIEQVAEEFRRERGLVNPAQFEGWRASQSVAEDEIVPYFRREATIRSVTAGAVDQLFLHLKEYLQGTGEYGELEARALAKHRGLSAAGLEFAELQHTGLSESDLWHWYFNERLGRSVPSDLVAYATSQHTDLEQLRSAVIREYCFTAQYPSTKT
jgi:hypothetical protein